MKHKTNMFMMMQLHIMIMTNHQGPKSVLEFNSVMCRPLLRQDIQKGHDTNTLRASYHMADSLRLINFITDEVS